MSDYMDFASLSLADLDAELAAMLATAKTKTEARAVRFEANCFTPAVTGNIFPAGTHQEATP